MLEPREASEVYHRLSEIARAHKLDWLLEDVERQIALGKEGTKDIQVESTLRSVPTDPLPKRKGRLAKFIVTQPFTEHEKLHLLIEALEAVSVGLSLGILNSYEILGETLRGVQTIGFAPDTEGSEITLIEPDIPRRKDSVTRLEQLLKELKEEV